MLNRRDVIVSTVAVAAVAALGGCTRRPKAVPVVDGALGIASAANPHVLPLLLAISLDPNLPVRLIPIAESVDADALFGSGQADGLLAMTYIGARKRISGAIPDLRLHSIATWRGFFEVVPEGVASFADLRGKTVIVSGPIGSGKDGGGDVIFQAAARRQGIVPGHDLLVEYMPAQQGIARVASGQASGITMPSPGNTGMVLRSQMAQKPIAHALMRLRGKGDMNVPLTSAIDFQRIFSGFASFPDGQLPLGGLHVSERALASPAKRAKIDRIARGYANAVAAFMADPGGHADAIASAYDLHFGPIGGGAPPAMLLPRSVKAGDLIYRRDITVGAVRADLSAWLGELLGRDIDPAFLAAV